MTLFCIGHFKAKANNPLHDTKLDTLIAIMDSKQDLAAFANGLLPISFSSWSRIIHTFVRENPLR